MDGKMMTLTYSKLSTVATEKLGQFFFHTYLLTYLNKNTPNLLKVVNIWTSSKVKYKSNGLLRILCLQNLFIKLKNIWKRKIHIAHHSTPNSIYTCILPHKYLKSPEMTWHSNMLKSIRSSIKKIFSS